jgi:hypothetical protein
MIRREAPEVITGARGPRDTRDAQAAEAKAKRGSGLQRAPEGKVRFQSAFSNLRIQLTAPTDIRDPFTGRITPGRPKAAQFRDNFYDVPVADVDTLQFLKSHPAYQKKFWLLDDVIAEGKKQQVEQARRVLMDPEQRAAVLEALRESGISDFSLPPVEANE